MNCKFFTIHLSKDEMSFIHLKSLDFSLYKFATESNEKCMTNLFINLNLVGEMFGQIV